MIYIVLHAAYACKIVINLNEVRRRFGVADSVTDVKACGAILRAARIQISLLLRAFICGMNSVVLPCSCAL